MRNKDLLLLFSFAFGCVGAQPNETTYSIAALKQDPVTTQKLLVDMLNINQLNLVERLLEIYQTFEQQDSRLVNLAKIKLAEKLFWNYQNKDAYTAFQVVKKQKNLTKEEQSFIEQHLFALDKRDSWHFDFSGHYVYNKNVNNATTERRIENTGFMKNNDMMPQSAKGIAYYGNAERNWNIHRSHYLHFSNDLSGKLYWNNHAYDEINSRTYLGYLYQSVALRGGIKPFYERQWLGNHRYNWSKGIRLEWQTTFAKKWQISTAFEWGRPHYFSQRERNGVIKLTSATIIWYPSNSNYVYLGTNFIQEKANVKQYSNNTKTLRLGWQKYWGYEIYSLFNSSISTRQFKDVASLGGILPLDKVRRDKIYTANVTAWKKNWSLYGFVPKLQFKYKRQKSNIPSMFSYQDKSILFLIEKAF